ncbi:hypothetical protein EIP91_009947 [Steccherinum ochraceum]|uniref:Uncharacterized protein n=1 Tax=Steccherinum ochraceum TaxID=92696 RepID=A0A4R0R130_9APHY|nr:hypothetical protein EIP91_009947 [Steccherinum ochraceum]
MSSRGPSAEPDDVNITQMSLVQFTTTAQNFFDRGDKFDFLRFTLAGLYSDGDHDRQVYLNARQSAERPDPRDLYMSRDLDSAFGTTRTLPFSSPIALFPVTPFRETLTRANHISHPMMDHRGRTHYVPMHKIPNFGLCKTMTRHITRIFLPKLYGRNPMTGAKVPAELLSQFYNECLRPSIAAVAPDTLTYWPVDYTHAYVKALDERHQLMFGTIDLPPPDLRDFEEELLRRMDAIPDFENAFFGHELRGTKNTTRHNPDVDQERRDALNEFTSVLDSTRINLHEWQVDVALEISYPGHVLQWLRIEHKRVLREAMPSLTDNQLQAVLNSKLKTKIDYSSQLRDLAGLRCTPLASGTGDRVSYINVYSTDKSVWYSLHKSYFRRMNYDAALPRRIDTLLKSGDHVSETFRRCAGLSDTGALQDGAARFEIRVPLYSALDALVSLPDGFFENALVAFESDIWWLFKVYRLEALLSVFRNHKIASNAQRSQPPSLLLDAVSVYMYNALMYRPKEGGWETFIVNLSCGGEYDEEDENVVVDAYSRGLYFVHDLWEDAESKAVRLPAFLQIHRGQLAHVFGFSQFVLLQQEFHVGGVVVPNNAPRHPTRRNNRIRQTTAAGLIRDQEPAQIAWGLDDDGVTLEPENVMVGDDVTMQLEGDSDNEDQDPFASGSVDSILQSIWFQLPADIISLSPNPKSQKKASYILLGAEARSNSTFELFQTCDLSSIFEQIQYKDFDTAGWQDKIFHRYFPPKGTKPRKMQNFGSATYFRSWTMLMTRLSRRNAEKVHARLRVEFDKLMWLPFPESDRMWSTKQSNAAGFEFLPALPRQPCPQIAFNAKVRKGARIQLFTHVRGDEDEEESE